MFFYEATKRKYGSKGSKDGREKAGSLSKIYFLKGFFEERALSKPIEIGCGGWI